MRLGIVSQLLFPGFSHCRKCKTTWNLVEPHTVWTEWNQPGHVGDKAFPSRGEFYMCEQCWAESTDAQKETAREILHNDRESYAYAKAHGVEK